MSTLISILSIIIAVCLIIGLTWLGMWAFKKAMPCEVTNLPDQGWLVLGHTGGAKYFHTEGALKVFCMHTKSEPMEWDIYRITNDILYYHGTSSQQ